MSDHWRQSTWGDEISLEYGKAIRGYQDSGASIRVFGSNGPIGWTETALAQGPGVILGRKGAYRGVHFSREPFYVIDTAYFVRPKTNMDMRWLYYAMIHHKLGEIDDGSPIPSTTRAAVYIQDFAVPAIHEQREIAAILGALDDKIELNRKTAETLEAMARALYRSWFVDFDPVWAKAEGRAPAHMDAATAALFPDDFGQDGLPMGWELGKLGEVARSSREGVDPQNIDPSTPYIGLEHIPRRSIALNEWGVADDVGSTKSVMRTGQFLFGKLRPYFHKVGMVPIDGICSTDIIVVEAKADQWREFVLSVISSVDLVDHVNAASTGTRMPRAKWQDLADYGITIAPPRVLEAFSSQLRPMHERISALIHESNTLAALRNTLLPRLMSGELRLGEGREQLEAVA
ncbi:MAG: restriction endonuclease subunit S [Tabrizicola sp.]|uniref:restriction endonuclease subunit S n=1 Tax=Tabrizicola sp. TaxID=2005166 RepID=UPI0027350579|nr:restriction endonuclease subunit S [Tabrizicola sp.]MDP3264398.1 restriction endonuclease subunit S [Tabrizicola sp.]MDP3646444.1 restriction endonuclease subunit S [Paracoccaceae bacterium]MDZ4068494.1 restriction endonuclease subunit S [Tabrizicola sp.]